MWKRCLTWFLTVPHSWSRNICPPRPTCVSLKRHTLCPLHIDFAATDRFSSYLAFHSCGHACQVLTGGKTQLFDKLHDALACLCLSEYINRLANPSVQGSCFVGCPASAAAPHHLSSHPTLPLPTAGIKAFSHAREAFSSRCLLGSITLRRP